MHWQIPRLGNPGSATAMTWCEQSFSGTFYTKTLIKGARENVCRSLLLYYPQWLFLFVFALPQYEKHNEMHWTPNLKATSVLTFAFVQCKWTFIPDDYSPVQKRRRQAVSWRCPSLDPWSLLKDFPDRWPQFPLGSGFAYLSILS